MPFGACTATAEPQKMRRIRDGLGISVNAIAIVEPVNRANLFYGAVPIKGSTVQGQGDLEWLIPACQDKGRDYDQREIPPTIIYVDNKAMAHKLAYLLQNQLPPVTHNRPQPDNHWDFDPRSRSERIVTPYHASLSVTMKEYIRDDWRSGTKYMIIFPYDVHC